MDAKNYDFSGWATRANVKCSDGRTIMQDAFKGNDGQKVPLVWNHDHANLESVVGHALLENRADGVYAYGYLNETSMGKVAKELIEHGDITGLSIYANQLRQQGGKVMHGVIREVSLVMAGANPKAGIEFVIRHGEAMEDEAVIFGGDGISLEHAEEDGKPNKEDGEETIGDVFETFNEKQKTLLYAMVGQAMEGAGGDKDNKNNDNNEGGNNMKHNVFDRDEENQTEVISHSEMRAVIDDTKRFGSMKESALQHGIEQIDYLFPDDKNLSNTPIFISRDMGWVRKVMGAVHHTPFSRIKSILADITEDDARARGYIKGKKKKDEVFSLLKRTTRPTTVYKKQRLDRDDLVDITDFEVVGWLKSEMRMMLDEELARAYLIGDGRIGSSDDKIDEQCIRPIWTDDDLFTIKHAIPVTAEMTGEEKAKAMIRGVIKARKGYKGSGSPTAFMSEDMLTECLLLTDATGRDLYDDETKLAKKLRVKEIVTVPQMEGLTRTDDSKTLELGCLVVNLQDYNVGADKGGAVNLFDDFDIDYNAQKYLIETRCSAALTVPHSAIAVEFETANA